MLWHYDLQLWSLLAPESAGTLFLQLGKSSLSKIEGGYFSAILEVNAVSKPLPD